MKPTLPRLQDLPPRWARFCLGIGSFAAGELGCQFSKLRCVVACSGGADSTALLLIAALLCRKDGGQVCAAHLNHGLRSEAPEDSRIVETLCLELGLPLFSERQDVATLARDAKIGIEEAGRLARYDFLERVRLETASDVILLGHQLNDLAEDQLLRLMRGVGWPALGGMAGEDAQRSLLRPLLLTPRSALELLLEISGRSWCTDSSNFERATTRNRVRLDVLPAMQRENPAYLDAAARLWRQARMDEAHWTLALQDLLEGLPPFASGGPIFLDAQTLRKAPPTLRLRLYKHALEILGSGQPLSDAMFQLEALWVSKAGGKCIRFPGDKEARITKSGIILQVIDRKKECG